MNPPYPVEQYVTALRDLGPAVSEGQRRMLAAHAEAPGRDLDVLQLAVAAGSSAPEYTYGQYGRLGHSIADALKDRTPQWVWTRVLAGDYRDEKTGLVRWVLHEEVAAAVRRLGWGGGHVRADPLSEVEHAGLGELSPTVRDALAEARIGQGLFRQKLITRWGGCAVTGCPVLEGLRASHIKPWRDATDEERLDPDNGLLLLATLDALFDQGLVTFDRLGHLVTSSILTRRARQQLGIRNGMRLRRTSMSQQRFLAWHRKKVFRA